MRVSFAVALGLLIVMGGAAAAPLPVSPLAIDTAGGSVRFTVELAAGPQSQARGLMFRQSMTADHGMLFDFHEPRPVTFWMKNTILPLDMIFIRADGTVSTVAANAVPYSVTPIPSAEPVRAVLEIDGGLAKALGIEPGARVHHAIFGDPPAGP